MPRPKIYDSPADRVRAHRQRQRLQVHGPLQSLFPYPGGKSAVAGVIWQRFGSVHTYVEAFAGSLAVLLARPGFPRIEVINDCSGLVVNFFRSVVTDPTTVFTYARWPVSGMDLWSRHDYLCSQRDALTARMVADWRFCDPELAGIWLYCMCTWTGSGVGQKAGRRSAPHTSHTGSGIHALKRRGRLAELCEALQDRLASVRLLCGDWLECLSQVQAHGRGPVTGILLDPPYTTTRRGQTVYGEPAPCAPAVRDWAIAHGENPRLRIALCGLEGEHLMPDTWRAYHWQARGGWANTGAHGRGSGTTRQETIWFSPFCLRPSERLLQSTDQLPLDI
jgi:site-specific DNA-adenine methylase